MNCAEFQKALPEYAEPERDTALQAHLRSCSDCSLLVSDLDSIVAAAPSLAEAEEPNPRIWLQLETALKNEGLIRQPEAVFAPRPRDRARPWWGLAWAVPVAAALVVLGVLLYRPPTEQQTQMAKNAGVTQQAVNIEPASRDDQDLLEVVGSQSPTMRAEYAANLKNVNAYIREAEETAKANPEDEQAQESLMNAYEQRSMVYEMAMDRSLP